MRGRGLVQADCPICGEVIAHAASFLCGVSEAEEKAQCAVAPGLRDFTRAASLIDHAREQSRLFLSGQPCHTCDQDHSRLGAAAPNGEVVRLQADLSVA